MHHRLWSSAILFGGLSMLIMPPVQAESLRCEGKLVSEGDTLYEVRSICGDPDAASQRVEYRTVRRYVSGPCYQDRGVLRCGYVEEIVVPVSIDEWTYDLGSHSLIRHLTFEQGRLFRIDTGGYGNKQ